MSLSFSLLLVDAVETTSNVGESYFVSKSMFEALNVGNCSCSSIKTFCLF